MRSTDHIVSRGLLGLVALAALGVAAPTRADVVYNNFGNPGDTYDTGGSWPLLGSATGNYVIAGFFTTGADGYGNLVFEGAFRHVLGTPGVTMRLMGDLGGLPDEGTVLDTSPTLVPVDSGSILTWNLDSTVTLAANTRYWFAASATNPTAFEYWMTNNTGQTGAAFRSTGTGSTWVPQPGSTTPAFRVSGRVLGAGAVPEPSEWAAMGVLGLGLGGLVVRKRRTR